MCVRAKMEDDASYLFNCLSCREMEIIVLEVIYEYPLRDTALAAQACFGISMEEDVEGLYPFVFVKVSSAVLGYQQALAADRVDCDNRGDMAAKLSLIDWPPHSSIGNAQFFVN